MVWREETVMLVVVLQWYVIQAGAPLDVYCGAIQELHKCLVSVVEEGDLFKMAKEIQEGVEKDPMVATILRASPSSEGAPLHTFKTEEPVHYPGTTVPGPKIAMSPCDLAMVPERWPPLPPGFSTQDPNDLAALALEDAHHVGGNDLVGPLCPRVTGDDHLPHPHDR